jgi:hypothetical protein
MVRIFLRGCPLYSDVADMPPLSSVVLVLL